MEFPVMFQGRTVGACRVEEQGLYWHIRCRCEILSDRVERLYWGSVKLGVLEREGDFLTLDRRLSKQSLPGFPPRDGVLSLEPDLEPWQGTVLDCPMPPGFLKREPGRVKLLFPFSPERPFPCMPLFCFFELDGPYWSLPLDEAGTAQLSPCAAGEREPDIAAQSESPEHPE